MIELPNSAAAVADADVEVASRRADASAAHSRGESAGPPGDPPASDLSSSTRMPVPKPDTAPALAAVGVAERVSVGCTPVVESASATVAAGAGRAGASLDAVDVMAFVASATGCRGTEEAVSGVVLVGDAGSSLTPWLVLVLGLVCELTTVLRLDAGSGVVARLSCRATVSRLCARGEGVLLVEVAPGFSGEAPGVPPREDPSAQAVGSPLSAAAPRPRAIARPPTRPINAASPMCTPEHRR